MDIFAISVEGTDVRNLTKHPSNDWGPSWSSEGRYIAFVTAREGKQKAYVMLADGTNQFKLTQDDADEGLVAWPPR